MGHLGLKYVREHSILRTEVSKSMATLLQLVLPSAGARDVSDTCC